MRPTLFARRARWRRSANSIASLPPEGQIALVSRRELALPLGRMRAHRQVFELTRRDLAMSRTESEALLKAIGLRLTSEEIEALYERTEGWPAALYLAGLSLGDRNGTPVDATHFGGDDRFVADYMRDEFLAGIPVARLRFLMPDLDSRGPRRQDLRRRSRADGVGEGPA